MPGQKQDSRDDFPEHIKVKVAKRASYFCSNPDCRCITIAPSSEDSEKFIYIGEAGHIYPASRGGPRDDPSITSEQRKSIENAIFLCGSCANMIDKNNGLDYPVNILEEWKKSHEEWVKNNLNKKPNSAITIINGTIKARGKKKVTGLKTKKPTIIKPGTQVTAEGEEDITGVDIG